jgi:hypothetical protein
MTDMGRLSVVSWFDRGFQRGDLPASGNSTREAGAESAEKRGEIPNSQTLCDKELSSKTDITPLSAALILTPYCGTFVVTIFTNR